MNGCSPENSPVVFFEGPAGKSTAPAKALSKASEAISGCRNMLLKIHRDTSPCIKLLLKKITKEQTIERKIRAKGIDEHNIINYKRKRV